MGYKVMALAGLTATGMVIGMLTGMIWLTRTLMVEWLRQVARILF